MYCSTCGVAVAQGLTYCNFCGAKVNGAKSDDASRSQGVRPELIVCAMIVVFIFGTIAITMLMGMMKSILKLETGQILPIAMLAFLMMLVIEGVCIRLLFRGKQSAADSDEAVQLRGHVTKELGAGMPEPVASVTEESTRRFEPSYRERDSK